MRTRGCLLFTLALAANSAGCSDKGLAGADMVSADGGGSGGSAAGGANTGGSSTGGGGIGTGGFGGAVQLSSVVANALDHCAMSPTGNPQTMEMVVPEALTGPQWGVLDFVCHEGGFDLSLCAGSSAELTSILTNQVPPGGSPATPYTAGVLTVGDQLCCVYKGDNDPNHIPGLASATCGPAYPALAAMSRCSIIPHPLDDQQTVEEEDVPSSFSQDALWAPRDVICTEGGYDLSGCAGSLATLVTVLENTFIQGNPEPIKAWILTVGDTVCCIWETDGATTPNLRARSCTL